MCVCVVYATYWLAFEALMEAIDVSGGKKEKRKIKTNRERNILSLYSLSQAHFICKKYSHLNLI